MEISLVFVMLVAWLGVTALLVVLFIVRAVVSLREADQLYIDPGEEKLLAEQRELVAKLDRLRPYLIGCFVASAVLGLATFGLWVYRQLQ